MKTTYQRAGVSTLGIVALTLALAACGPAPGPGGAGLESGPGQSGTESKAARGILQYDADELVDLATYPEPPPDKAGGIPPEDLTATPKYGGVVKMMANGPVEPHFDCCGTLWPHRVWASGLLRYGMPCGCPQPDLAESWTVAPDGLSYDFKLRKGVKFQNLPPVNGREVTAQDIKWSLDRVSGLRESKGKQTAFAPRFVNVKEFQIVNDTTLRMVMKQRDVQILAEVMYDYIVVLPQEAAIDGDFSQPKSYVGSGPFQVEYGEPGGNWKFKRHPEYWEKDKAGRQLPYLDGVFSNPASDAAATVAGFKTRQVDTIRSEYDNGRAVLGDPTVRYTFNRGMVNGGIGIYMNMSTPPFNDIRARRAVNLALDRDELAQAYAGGHDAGYVVSHLGAWEPWAWSEAKVWSMPGYAKGEAKKQEIEEAKRLLAEAGFGGGLTLTFDASGDLYELVASQLKKVGITTKPIATRGANKYASTTRETGRHLAHSEQGGGHVPDSAVSSTYLCNAVQNISLYCNPELDKLYSEERRTRETAKRLEIIAKIQDILWEDMPMAPHIRKTRFHASYKYVRGWRNMWYDSNWSQGFQTAYMWLDK